MVFSSNFMINLSIKYLVPMQRMSGLGIFYKSALFEELSHVTRLLDSM